MKNGLVKMSKWIWGASSMSVLLTTLYFYDGKPNSDADILLAYGMLALSFPAGLIISAIVGVAGYVVFSTYGYVVQTSYWSILLTWLIFFVVGYWQWFRLVPWLIRRIKGRNHSTA